MGNRELWWYIAIILLVFFIIVFYNFNSLNGELTFEKLLVIGITSLVLLIEIIVNNVFVKGIVFGLGILMVAFAFYMSAWICFDVCPDNINIIWPLYFSSLATYFAGLLVALFARRPSL